MTGPAQLPHGFTIGHWTDEVGRTGCTVLISPAGAVGGVDIRGAASSTLSADTLRPGNLVERAHAVLLTGGSAFGLEAAAGVMRYLEEHEVGYEMISIRVPIVVGAVIFDLFVGDPRSRPGRDAGYAACTAASRTSELGSVGAGTGATVAKGGDGSQRQPGGLGIASGVVAGATVTAVMAVNSVGGVWDSERGEWVAELSTWDRGSGLVPGTNTTIGAVLTDARLTKVQANGVATAAHDGIARAIRPSRTMYDGDTMFCLAGGEVEAPYDAVQALAAEVVERAIVAGVRAAQP